MSRPTVNIITQRVGILSTHKIRDIKNAPYASRVQTVRENSIMLFAVKCGAHLAFCGPTFPISKEELAVKSSSFITPDCMPSADMHWAEKKNNNNNKINIQTMTSWTYFNSIGGTLLILDQVSRFRFYRCSHIFHSDEENNINRCNIFYWFFRPYFIISPYTGV